MVFLSNFLKNVIICMCQNLRISFNIQTFLEENSYHRFDERFLENLTEYYEDKFRSKILIDLADKNYEINIKWINLKYEDEKMSKLYRKLSILCDILQKIELSMKSLSELTDLNNLNNNDFIMNFNNDILKIDAKNFL
jgi:hypothetical protein